MSTNTDEKFIFEYAKNSLNFSMKKQSNDPWLNLTKESNEYSAIGRI
jgi:hypothetical protein